MESNTINKTDHHIAKAMLHTIEAVQSSLEHAVLLCNDFAMPQQNSKLHKLILDAQTQVFNLELTLLEEAELAEE